MWGELFGWLKVVFSLAKDVREDRARRDEMHKKLDNVAKIAQFLLYHDELRRRDEEQRRRDEEQRRREEAQERENLLLRLKIQFLEFERRLPPPPPGAPPAPPLNLESE